MRTKPKGVIHRGSSTHQILAELERYPDSWYQWHQFPHLDVVETTMRRSIQRLVASNRVEHRLVLTEDEVNRGRDVLEIRWKEAS